MSNQLRQFKKCKQLFISLNLWADKLPTNGKTLCNRTEPNSTYLTDRFAFDQHLHKI